MKRRMHRLFYGIKIKLLLPLFVMLIAAVTLLTTIGYQVYLHRQKIDSAEYAAATAQGISQTIGSYLDELTTVSDMVLYNRYVQEYLMSHFGYDSLFYAEDTGGSFQASLEVLVNILIARQDVKSVYIVEGEQVILSKSANRQIDLSQNYAGAPWYREAVIHSGSPIVRLTHRPLSASDRGTYFSISSAIGSYDGRYDLGVVLLEVSDHVLREYCGPAKYDPNSVVLLWNGSDDPIEFLSDQLDNQDRETYRMDKEAIIGALSPHMTANRSGQLTYTSENRRYLIAFHALANYGMSVAYIVPADRIAGFAGSSLSSILTSAVLILAVTLVTTYRISSVITSPIVTLKKQIDSIDSQSLDRRTHVDTSDEIGALSQSFNNLLARIEQLMKQVVSEQRAKRRLELRVLQHQINPHFLYNTLDSIIWMIECGDPQAVEAIESLSRYFRISLNHGRETIALRDELEHVRNYLFIQKMRYDDKFDYAIDCGGELLGCSVPHLILQPLVENAIYHGLKNKLGNGIIRICGWEEASVLVITVSDNGVGMEEQTVEGLLDKGGRRREGFRSGSGIGLRNVHERIVLSCGNEYGLCFASAVDEGTTVTVRLPLDFGEKSEAE